MANVLDLLDDRVLLGDGATGTYLYSLGIPATHCLEEANISERDLVARVYSDYAQAGANVIETNSFGANRIRLARYGLEDRVNEINWLSARIAREATKKHGDIIIGGSVGPLSLRITDPVLTPDEIRNVFREQIGALLDGGCDMIFLETFSDLKELFLALEAFQNLSNVPVLTSLAVTEEGRLGSGEDLVTAWKKLRAAGADIVSINGTCGIQATRHLLSQVDVTIDDMIAVYPNAGKPEFYEGRFNYDAGADYFARSVPDLVAEGARLIGGDYGTTPVHIAAMAEIIRGLKPVKTKKALRAKPAVSVLESTAKAASKAGPEYPAETSILDNLQKGVVQIVELDSPKTLAIGKFIEGARALKAAGASAITLADNSLAILRVSNFAAAVMLRDSVGITPMIHMACRDRNLLGMQSELMGMSLLGFRHLLALTGDSAKFGDHPGATNVFDLNSVSFIKMLKGLNEGSSHAGRKLNGNTNFLIGCAFNPNSKSMDSQVKKLEMKIAAGAQYVLTQPVFDPALVHETARRLKPLGIPVFIGVMPVLHSRNAEFLHNEVPGIKIPDNIRERLRAVDDKQGAAIGLELAREIKQAIMEHYNGVYIITPFLRYELSAELLQS
ncbi:MAG TPA: bifunctional homocysteine S-methyltransferase/methylenetetrahydrofolate reductase [Candidatus Methylacidiphilales bacterium]|nr:bifunctional homocysteine S-methyltransferase/methylenetetrahydrofolate reductase [Candidatus Methylacidiphilales bacterium]